MSENEKKQYCTQCGCMLEKEWLFCRDCGSKIQNNNEKVISENYKHSNLATDTKESNFTEHISPAEQTMEFDLAQQDLKSRKSTNLFDTIIEHISGVKTYRISPHQMGMLIYDIYLRGKLKETQYSICKKIKGTSGFLMMDTNLTSDDGRYILHIGHVHRGYIYGIRRNVWIKDCQTDICYEIGIYEHSKLLKQVNQIIEQAPVTNYSSTKTGISTVYAKDPNILESCINQPVFERNESENDSESESENDSGSGGIEIKHLAMVVIFLMGVLFIIYLETLFL